MDKEQMKLEVPFMDMKMAKKIPKSTVNMNEVVGNCDILFVCLDTLRYDVASEEEEKNTTPILNQYGKWRKCQAPANFTYPSHHAMFSGFFPCDYNAKSMMDRELLFFPKNIGLGRKAPENTFAFEGATFVEGLAKVGYDTYCIGGVSFFDKRSDIGNVFPSFFNHSYWRPSFGCQVKNSTENQVDLAIKLLEKAENEQKEKEQNKKDQKIFMYINIDAIHYPNYFYLEGAKKDNKETHAAALRYVDGQLERLFDAFAKRGQTFVICCSDHGTCYGEDECVFHGMNHPVVNTIPYKHFFINKKRMSD